MPAVRARSLNCTQCGSPVGVRNALKAKVAACQSCGSVLDLTSPKFEILAQARLSQEPRGLICLGMKATFRDATWEVIGLIELTGFDQEDVWRWDEWLLISDSGQYAWISHDEGTYAWQSLFTPTDPPSRESILNDRRLTLGERVLHVRERDTARITHMAGELTWKASLDDRIGYVDLSGGYGIEYVDDEIEFYKAEKLPPAKIYEMFSMSEHLEILEAGRQQNAARAKRGMGGVWALLICLCGGGVMWTASCGGAAMNESLVNESIPLAAHLPGPSTVGSVTLDESVSNYKMGFSVKMRDAVDRLDIALESPSGTMYPLFNFELDGPGWGNRSDNVSFTVPESGTWDLVVSGTVNGSPMPTAPPGYYNPTPTFDQPELRWTCKEVRFNGGYNLLTSMCSGAAGFGFLLLALMRSLAYPWRNVRQEILQATRRHHEATRNAGVQS